MPAPDKTSCSSSSSSEGTGDNQHLDAEVTMNIDRLMENMMKLSEKSPPGLWIASTDMILHHPHPIKPLDMSDMKDCVCALTVKTTPQYAMKHGACKISESGEVSRIIHMASEEVIKSWTKPDGTCDMLAGIVYVGPSVAKSMVYLHTVPPLDACTYFGLDNGAQPLSLSLFFDILLCMTTDIEKEEFVVSGQSRAGPAQQPSAVMRRARTLLWNTFSGTKMKAVHLVGVQHDYLRHVAADVCNRYLQSHEEKHCVINSRVQSEAIIGDGSVLINCNIQLYDWKLPMHIVGCFIQHPIVIGANCFLSGVTNTLLELQAADLSPVLTVPDGIAVQEIRVTMGTAQKCFRLDVCVVYGINDLLTVRIIYSLAQHTNSIL
jgi:fucokinase